MSKFLFLFCIIVYLFKTETVFSDNSIYDVNNIKVSGKLNNNLDNSKLLESAFKKAFLIFINKTLLIEDIKSLNNTKIKTIKDLIFTYQIISRKKNNNQESELIVNVKFDQRKINNYFSINNISYADVSNISISILPIIKKNNNIFIFSDNFFYNEWNKIENNKTILDSELINYNLALENAEDLFYINSFKDNLELIDIKKLSSLNKQENKIFLVFFIEDKVKVFIKAYFNNREIIKNININLKTTNDTELFKAAIINIKNQINQIWKEQNLIDINTPSYLDIFFEIKKINDLFNFRIFLDGVDVIENHSILEMTNKYAKVRIRYKGRISNLRNEFSREKIELKIKNNQWRLRLTR
tara:strand:- start:2082 stop:3149 length:1068 start_codon:yes stop_codon:yes gene_type:complete